MIENNNIDLQELQAIANGSEGQGYTPTLQKDELVAPPGTQETKLAGSDWMNEIRDNNTTDYIPPTETPIANKPVLPEIEEEDSSYYGPGLVIDDNYQSENDPNQGVVDTGGMTGQTLDNINKYMEELDSDIAMVEEFKKDHPEIDEEKSIPMDVFVEEDNQMTQDEFTAKYNEAVVVIDKSGMGQVINFTDEERDKLSKAKSIKLEEVETIELSMIKTKKPEKNSKITNILKNTITTNTTNIALGASGYTATMSGLSAQEIVNLFTPNNNPVIAMQTKWGIIYDKIVSSSIPFKNFNDFLMHTAASDLGMFVYGILCATYPEDDVMPLTCDKCGQSFEHKYSIKSLIRAEEMSPSLQALLSNAIDSSFDSESANNTHSVAPVNQVKRIKLPSGIIAEIYTQNAHDFINKSLKEYREVKDNKYGGAMIVSSSINKFYVPDSDGTYIEYDDAKDIMEIVYNLSVVDNKIITNLSSDATGDLNVHFGLMDITCPHCKNYTSSFHMDIEQILFYKYQQEMETSIK